MKRCNFCKSEIEKGHYCDNSCLQIEIKLDRLEEVNITLPKEPIIKKEYLLQKDDLILFNKMFPEISRKYKTLKELDELLNEDEELLIQFNSNKFVYELCKR